MKAIQLLINSELPPELRDYERPYDKKSISKLLALVAQKHPSEYGRIAKRISDIGRTASYLQGETLTLNDMKPVIDREKLYAQMDEEIDAARKALPKGEFQQKKLEIWGKYANKITELTTDAALKQDSNLAYSVVSGARGKPDQLRSMISTPAMYADAQDKPVPVFVRRSLGDGIRPAEYLASTYGARKAVIATKVATAKGGDLCLAEGTQVRMADGSIKEIQDIKVGDKVLGSSCGGLLEPVTVTATFDQGEKNVVKITLPAFNGAKKETTEIICTKDHKFATIFPRRKEKISIAPVKDWTNDSQLVQSCRSRFENRTFSDIHYGLLIGLMLGDGSMPNCKEGDKSRVAFTCADPKLIDDIEEALLIKDLVATPRTEDPIQYRFSTVKSGPNPLKQLIKELGLAGCKAATKKLPNNIFEWYDDAFLYLLAGYLATDGCLTTKTDGNSDKKIPYISFSSVSQELLRGIREQLQLRFGIYGASIHEIAEEDRTGFAPNGPAYFFTINRQDEVSYLLEKMPTIPGAKGLIQATLLQTLTSKWPCPEPKIYTRNAVIEKIGKRPCYDIEVDHPDHLFVLANGIVTSNSKQMVQVATPLIISQQDCGTKNGIDLDIDDKSLKGRVLADNGSVVDRQALNGLRKKGTKKVIVRSPLTCEAETGLCSKCVGVNAKGHFPPIGEAIGIAAGQAIGEPITQGALNCLAIGTEVLMADFSIKRIEDIHPGDQVMGSDVKGKTFPTKVTATWDQGMQPVQRRFYRMGQTKQLLTLDSTAKHPVLSNRKTYGKTNGKNNSKTEKLVAGYSHTNLAAVLPVSNELDAPVNEPWAVLLGVFLGDGIRWDSNLHAAPKISCADPVEIKDLNTILNPLNIRLKKTKRSFDWALVMIEDTPLQRTEDGRVTTGVRSPVKKKLLEWSLDGKYAHQKSIPKEAWLWNKDSIGALVAGFIAADGSVYKNKDGHVGISFAGNSYSLISGLKDILAQRLCVYSSSITCTGKAGEGNRKHDMWQFTITRQDQVNKLAEYILPYLPGVKRERLRDYLASVNYELRNPDEFYRAKRVDTEELGQVHCYDITVEHEDSLFVLANGLIVSNTKHSGGAASGKDKKSYSGFDVISRFVQTPEQFPDRAVVSQLDGTVNQIKEAPQGGYYVTVDQEQHYVNPGYELLVKKGDKLEAGDQISEGLIDPGEIVELRGLGEGRRYYTDRLQEILDDSGSGGDRRNTEVVARAALDHIQIDDADDGDPFLPDDVISYGKLRKNYILPEDTKRSDLKGAVGTYLQQPALHYTIGTRITPKIAKRLQEAGKDSVYVSQQAPKFRPHMVRLRTAGNTDRDWLAGMHTSYLKSNLEHSAIRGEETNIKSNPHFAPRLAIGKDFGKDIERTGKF